MAKKRSRPLISEVRGGGKGEAGVVEKAGEYVGEVAAEKARFALMKRCSPDEEEIAAEGSGGNAGEVVVEEAGVAPVERFRVYEEFSARALKVGRPV